MLVIARSAVKSFPIPKSAWNLRTFSAPRCLERHVVVKAHIIRQHHDGGVDTVGHSIPEEGLGNFEGDMKGPSLVAGCRG